MNWSNKITHLLKTKYPIIQAPMLVVSTPEMIATSSNLGCLGSLPLGFSEKQKALEKIQQLKQLTTNPFAVNFFAYDAPNKIPDLPAKTLRSFYEKNNIPFYPEIPHKDPFTYYTELIDIIIEQKVPVVSFHFGIPDSKTLNTLKSNGIITIATATCVDEAKMIEDRGIDIIVAQSFEAGGNKGTFINGDAPEIGLISLLPRVIDAVKIPVIAAGGLMEGRSLAAAFTLGAQGVQLGSVFLRSKDSGAPSSWKEAVKNSDDRSTTLTRAWSGRFGRCIKNEYVKGMQGEELHPSPVQHYLTNKMREEGRKRNDPELQSLWAGQSANYAEEKSTKEILEKVIKDTENILTKPFSF